MNKPLVGAIRWDAWHGAKGMPGLAVQEALGPSRWRNRVPFFGKVVDDDHVLIDGTDQGVMDREIDYAASAGLDYWGFLLYQPADPMSIGLARYLSSRRRDRIRFCAVTECSRWGDPAFFDRLSDLMTEPGYVKVLDGRPVIYLGFIKQETVAKTWGDEAGYRRAIDRFRSDAIRKGAGNPYLVIMDFNPAAGRRWLDVIGADALSAYATSGGGMAAPYAALAAHAEQFWQRCADTGAAVAPIVMSGWDRRPRVLRPMPWETWQKAGVGLDKYYEPPTPAELAAHLGRALAWIDAHPIEAAARLALIYAWNENDEGGWLMPTLGEGTARLDALRAVLVRSASG